MIYVKAKASSQIAATRYLCMGSQLRRRPESFKIALGILLDVQKNNGELGSGLDEDLRKLWVYTLIGMGYIRKEAQNIVITEKGKEERGQMLNERKMLVPT